MNRRHRLRSRAAFRAVGDQRAASATGSLRVAVAPNGGLVARVGFAIPRAVGGAVVRNGVRRRLRETLRPRLAELEGLDVVVSVRPAVRAMATAQLVAEVERCTDGAVSRLGRDARPGRADRP